ncbi:acyltransferase family protein [Rothia aerolata]|uniref:acyltransferase family protein n=1 Tax=Rothia aerolata TaxID=1812262 RepID=UPI00166AAD87|nr:acyltransferase family protein [Rothia aerolata]
MTTTPVSASTRMVGIDLARCVALVSMFVAHVAPSAGPGGVLNLSEFLTAALFAMLVGISAELSKERMNFPTLFASSVVRGIGLIALGLYIASWGAQVDIVLQYLGLLSIIVALLVFLPTWLNAVIALASWWFTPWAMAYFEPVHQRLVSEGSLLHYLTLWMFEGPNYRTFTMVAWAAAGIVLIRLVRNRAAALQIFAAPLLTAAAGATWYYAHTIMEFLPYTGNRWEVGFDLLLAASAVCWCLVIARVFSRRESFLEIFTVAGRMTLSLYVLQIALLALYADLAPSYGFSSRDDSWPMLVFLTVISLLFAWIWHRAFARTFIRRGPLETIFALLTGRG